MYRSGQHAAFSICIMYESIIVFRAKRDPSRRAAHSCKSSIGRMKRVIRYTIILFINDASVFRESRFPISLLWFRETTPPPLPLSPCVPLRTRASLFPPRDRSAVREDSRGTPIVSREKELTYVVIERFREGKSRASRKIPFRRPRRE